MLDQRPRRGSALAGLLLLGLVAPVHATPDGGAPRAPPEAVVTAAGTAARGATPAPATPIPSTEPPESYRLPDPAARGWLPALVLVFGVLVVAMQVFARGGRPAGEPALTVVIIAALFAGVTGVEGAPLAALTGLLGVIAGFTLARVGRGG